MIAVMTSMLHDPRFWQLRDTHGRYDDLFFSQKKIKDPTNITKHVLEIDTKKQFYNGTDERNTKHRETRKNRER